MHTASGFCVGRTGIFGFARRFFECAIDLHDVPSSITIDKIGANTAAVRCLIADSGTAIELRQSKLLSGLVGKTGGAQ